MSPELPQSHQDGWNERDSTFSDLPLKGVEMTLAEGTRALADQLTAERKAVSDAIERAANLFESFPDGIAERDLISMVKDDLDVKLYIAAAAVERLEASGKAMMDWKTGILTHPR